MAADAPITQMVDTAAFAHSHTLVSTVKRKLIIAVPIPVPMVRSHSMCFNVDQAIHLNCCL